MNTSVSESMQNGESIQNSDSIQNSYSINDSINEYYKLKNKYETDILKQKKKIISNSNYSLKEKRREYKKLINKCINCKKPGGTIFTTKYDEESRTRILSAVCGVIADPCYLDIKINAGSFENVETVLKELENTIKDYKNKIINDKNKLLFGYITSEQALENFSENKTEITDYTSLLETYINKYAEVTNNKTTQKKINDEIERTYELINEIKESIKNYNINGNVQFINDAANIYVNSLKPMLTTIMNLKYKKSIVLYNDDDNTYNLIQKQYDEEDLQEDLVQQKVIKFDYGIESQKKKIITPKKSNLIIENSSDEESSSLEKDKFVSPNYNYNSDGTVEFGNQEYENIWKRMSEELKKALLTDRDWLEKFMNSCYLSRKNNRPCELVLPDNLILPPNLLENGTYDLGNQYFNDVFNSLNKSYKETLLTLRSIKNGAEDYSLMEDGLIHIIKRKVNFDRGYF